MRPLFVLPALLLAAAPLAHATTLYYSFTGVETTGRADTLTFTVPDARGGLYGFDYFAVDATSLVFNGTTLLSAAGFYLLPGYPADSGLQTYGGQFGFAFVGSLFSGLNPGIAQSNAVLVPGTFTLDSSASIASYPDSTYRYDSGTLVVSATPIPAAAITPNLPASSSLAPAS